MLLIVSSPRHESSRIAEVSPGSWRAGGANDCCVTCASRRGSCPRAPCGAGPDRPQRLVSTRLRRGWMPADGSGIAVHAHRSDAYSWAMVTRAPDPHLKPYVIDYIGYRERAAGPMRRLQA